MATAAEAEPTTTLNPSDYLDTDWLLSDEEKLIRENVRKYVQKEVVPHVGDWFDKGHLPEPGPHYADHLAIQAVMICRVVMETIVIGIILFGLSGLLNV